jgi:hypothetical protein
MPSANSKLYSKYKQLEKKAITLLLSRSSESYGNWSVGRLELEAITAIPSLDYAKLISVAGYLEESLKLREIYSSRFTYAPVENQKRHTYWKQRMRRIIQYINHRINEFKQEVQTLVRNDVSIDYSISELKEKVEALADDEVSVNETAFSCFLEDIEGSLAQAEALWSRFSERKTRLSTASLSLCLLLLAKTRIANPIFSSNIHVSLCNQLYDKRRNASKSAVVRVKWLSCSSHKPRVSRYVYRQDGVSHRQRLTSFTKQG